MSIRSMTGFARLRKNLPEGEISVSVKSVNHRGLDLHFHLSAELDGCESALRNLVKSRVLRGHLQIHITLIPKVQTAGSALNRTLMSAYINAFREAQAEFGLSGEPDVNGAFRIPGMFRADATGEVGPEVEKAVIEIMDEALSTLNRFREHEGAAIAEEMQKRCAGILEQGARMEEIREQATTEFNKRLKERLRSLLRGAGVDPQRIAQEAALLVDRSDVSEELMRLKTHAGQLDTLLKGGGEVGKKLDFLLQEMNREANTILSKTGGLGDLGLTITGLALAAKAEIDKIREQSLNLE